MDNWRECVTGPEGACILKAPLERTEWPPVLGSLREVNDGVSRQHFITICLHRS